MNRKFQFTGAKAPVVISIPFHDLKRSRPYILGELELVFIIVQKIEKSCIILINKHFV